MPAVYRRGPHRRGSIAGFNRLDDGLWASLIRSPETTVAVLVREADSEDLEAVSDQRMHESCARKGGAAASHATGFIRIRPRKARIL